MRADIDSGRRINVPEWLRLEPLAVLGLVSLAALLCRVFWLDRPRTAIVGDENFYVNAARIILGRSVAHGLPYAGQPSGIDPNREHPPLGKLVLAGTMWLFGDNAYSWRLPSVVAGLASIVLLYLIVRAATADEWLAVLAASVFAFDNLVFVHSRMATLDMFLVVLLLLGVWLWFRGRRLAAGAALGVAALVKLAGVYGCAALVLLELGRAVAAKVRDGKWSTDAFRSAAFVLGGFVVVWFFGLWLLDLAVTPYNYPWDHLAKMLKYGFSLHRPGGPAGVESQPWQWLANEVQIPYYRVNEDLSVGGQVVASRPIVWFRGAMNPVVIGTAPLAVSYVAWHAWRFRDRLSLWVVAWVVATYFSFFPLAVISHRTMYIFYALLPLPAVAVAIAQLLRALPRVVVPAYLLALLVGFADYFPFRRIF